MSEEKYEIHVSNFVKGESYTGKCGVGESDSIWIMGREFANILMPLGICDSIWNDREHHSNFPSQLLAFFKGSMIHHDKIMQNEDLIVFTEKPTITKGSYTEAQHQTGVSMCRRLRVSWIIFQNLSTCILSMILHSNTTIWYLLYSLLVYKDSGVFKEFM